MRRATGEHRAPNRIRCNMGSVLAAVLLCLAATQEPASAAQISVSVRDSEQGLTVTATALLNTDIATAWQVLTDYDQYAQFIPGLHSSRVVGRIGARVTVEQSVEMPLWLFRAPADITYAITEMPPNRLQSRSSGGCACSLESTYSLSGTQSHVRLDYVGRFVAASPLFRFVGRTAAVPYITQHFEALANEIEETSGERHRSEVHE
jgi:carbon monoxide dehydrogenase subunit G